MTLGRVSRPLYEYYVLLMIQLSLQTMEKSLSNSLLKLKISVVHILVMIYPQNSMLI